MANNENYLGKSGGGLVKALIAAGGGLMLIVVGVFAGPLVRNMGSDPADDGASASAAESVQAAFYISLDPPLVVNFKDALGDNHYMQIDMELMARDRAVIDAVKEHAPVIRNSLILLYGNADYDAVTTRSGKEAMLSDGLAEIQAIMTEHIGSPGVEAVYFTNLIIQ
ncbi:MAG: flagellar basal body-associated FliL family protein [Woeseia sp.]